MATAWFDKGRPALLQALTSVCDGIGQDILAELQSPISKPIGSKDQSTQTSEDQHAGFVTLEAQNQELPRHPAKFQSSSVLEFPSQPHATGLSEPRLPAEGKSDVGDALTSPTSTASGAVEGGKCRGHCSKILKRYCALDANFKAARDTLEKRVRERDEWIQHAENLCHKIRAAEKQYGIVILDQKVHRIEASTTTATEAEDGPPGAAAGLPTDVALSDVEPQLPILPVQDAGVGEELMTNGVFTQSTQGQPSDSLHQSSSIAPPLKEKAAVTVGPDLSSGSPEIVSERKVGKGKRRRGSDQDSATVLPLVKTEATRSSSPIMAVLPIKTQIEDSIDLGEIEQRFETPRKRLAMESNHFQTDIVPRPRLNVFTPEQASTSFRTQSAGLSRRSSILMPLDANTHLIRPKMTSQMKHHKRLHLEHGVASLAEDGIPHRDILLTPNGSAGNRQTAARGRLGALLHGPVQDVENLETPSKCETLVSTSAHEVDFGVPGRRELPFDKDVHRSERLALSRRMLSSSCTIEAQSWSGRVMSPPRGQRQSVGSLRRKPVSELQLTDFRINPAANEGRDFAFSEVVRDKGDRACLPGCVDMHCCGKQFRALAISQKPTPPLTAAQRQEEQKLLEEYLGDYSYRLATMDRDERLEMWIEAKTQELANKYGKHRHRFSRMQSPPGFWNADFPDTQQLEVDKAEAEKRARRMIGERYREAMQPNGRWKFLDE